MAGTAENEAVEEAPPAPAPAPAKRAGSMLLMIAGLAGGSLGGVAGAYLVAPRLAGASSVPAAATAPATAASPEAEAAPAKGDKKDTKAPSPAHVYRIDNVIVNPAGSDGTRFLMASVAYEIPDDLSEQMLHAHEVQMRDDVIGILGQMTMEQLMAPHARDTIKVHLLGVARAVLGPQTPIDVYIPQFVIQ